MSRPREEGSFSRINFRCNLWNRTDQVSARVVLWRGRPAGATLFYPGVTLILFEIKRRSSQNDPDPFFQEALRLNQLLTFSANTEPSLPRSLPEPPFTLVLSEGVIIPTNCRLDVLGQWGHPIAPTTLFNGPSSLHGAEDAAWSAGSGASRRSSAVNIWGIIKVFQELRWFMEQLTPPPPTPPPPHPLEWIGAFWFR